MNLLQLNTSIIRVCYITSILFSACNRHHETKPLYQCSKDMVDDYCLNITYVDTLSKDTLLFAAGAPDNYYEEDLVETDQGGYRLFYDMERYKTTLVSGSIAIEYFLEIEERVNGGRIFDGLEINISTSSTSSSGNLSVIMADQSEFNDCAGVDTGGYIVNGYEYYTQFAYYDSVALNNTYYYKIYLNTLNNYSIYFTKDEGIIAFKTPDNKFYMQQ